MPSSSLIPPPDDPTLLLTSAGMVQFKPYFLGEQTPPNPIMTSAQKCFRVTDVEEVGDSSHLTFFEMLGNFSVGAYFKEKAIQWAWEFVTERMGLPKEKLWASIYKDDDEAKDLWLATGLPEKRIRRFDEKENFWGPAGNEGPCGPSSEIHYDFGGECRIGLPEEKCGPNCECGRFLELWNLVFMQLYQDKDGGRSPLPKPNIDTGMGLERACLILQGVNSLYETDLFKPIVDKVCHISGKSYGEDEETDVAIRVLAEHSRSAAFLIADSVVPDNQGRGYVLRRLIRRAIRFARKLGLETGTNENLDDATRSILAAIAQVVIDQSKEVYPNLGEGRDFILRVLQQEEERFSQVYETGMAILNEMLDSTTSGSLSGKDAFVLYDTYGFPFEVTSEIAQEHGITVKMADFEKEMTLQRERGRAASGSFAGQFDAQRQFQSMGIQEVQFLGYDTTSSPSTVIGIMIDGSPVEKASKGQSVEVILKDTPFYPEGGGQVGDKGLIEGKGFNIQVIDTQSPVAGIIVHSGSVLEGTVINGAEIVASVDAERRLDAARNHTATHLLHAALRVVLGNHVRQAGSLVTPERLRFDFTHVSQMTTEELEQVEKLVNYRIKSNVPVVKRDTTFREAVSQGALAFFGDRYADEVRVVEIANGDRFSFEVCGGTHVRATGDIGYCHVTGENGIGAGMRRLEAVTGKAAEALVNERADLLRRVSTQLDTSPNNLEARVASLLTELSKLRKDIAATERASGRDQAEALLSTANDINGFKLVSGQVESNSNEALRELGDLIRGKLVSGAIVIGSVINDAPIILVMITKDLVNKGLNASEAVKTGAKLIGGGGGGRADIAQAGGNLKAHLEEGIQASVQSLANQIE